MGTQHLTCVVLNGEYKIAQYGFSNGLPQATGLDIMHFIEGRDLDEFRRRVPKLRFLSQEESEQMNSEYKNYRESLSEEEENLLYQDYDQSCDDPTPEFLDRYLSHPFFQLDDLLGPMIIEYVMRYDGPLQNNISFAGFSLECEWVYVIDLDKNQFEVYRGLNKEPVPSEERFGSFPKENGNWLITPYVSKQLDEYKLCPKTGDMYYPVKHLTTIDFRFLPDDEEFIELCPEN